MFHSELQMMSHKNHLISTIIKAGGRSIPYILDGTFYTVVDSMQGRNLGTGNVKKKKKKKKVATIFSSYMQLKEVLHPHQFCDCLCNFSKMTTHW